ncbi:MAG: TIM barrel protein [Steroidobacteraceae bacterium]
MTRALVLEFLSAREISPAALVRLAARNQVRRVSVCIKPFKALSGEAVPFADLIDWDLSGDTPNRRELKRICQAEGVSIASADPFFVRSEADIAGSRRALESAAWLEAGAVTLIVMESDMARLRELMAGFCAVANEYGLDVLHEHSPRMPLKTVTSALTLQRSLDASNLRLVVDALHFFRGANALSDLVAVRADEIARIQLCDAPLNVPSQGGGYEAFYERKIPGEGVFPLHDLLAALPEQLEIGMEVPLWQMQNEGVQAAERVQLIVDATHRLLARVAATKNEHGTGEGSRTV